VSIKESAVTAYIVDSGSGKEAVLKKGNMTIPVAKFWGVADYYKQGLQKNYEDLVNMQQVANSYCLLMQNLILSKVFNFEKYKVVVAAYDEYISKHRSYAEIQKFLDSEEW